MSNILITICISIFIIGILHFFLKIIKTPRQKTKNLVDSQTEKYRRIMNELTEHKKHTSLFLSLEKKEELEREMVQYIKTIQG